MKLPPLVAAVLALLASGYSETDRGSSTSEHPAKNQSLAGIPFYKFYEEKDIGDAAQGNFISSAPDGRLFYGNESGIYVFDGSSWKSFYRTEETRDKVRSIVWTENETYAAGYGRIGRFIESEDKSVEFETITPEALQPVENEYFATAHRIGQNLFFIGEQSVVHHNLNNQETRVHKLNTWTKGSIVRNNELFVATEDQGLLRHNKNSFTPIPSYEKFTGRDVIVQISSTSNNHTMFMTMSGDIYSIDQDSPIGGYKPFNYKPSVPPTDFSLVGDGLVAISTAGRGIDILDKNGIPQNTLHKAIDYRWASAGFLHTDQQGTLWTLSGNSIAKILINDPLTPIDQRIRPNLFYPTLKEANGTTYLNNLTETLEPHFGESGTLTSFTNSLPNLEISTSAILPALDGLYLFADEGVFLQKPEGAKKVSDLRGIERAHAFHSNPNRLLVCSPDEVSILERQGENLKLIASTPTRSDFVNRIACTESDTFWLEYGLGVIQKIEYRNREIQISVYDETHGLPTDWITVWQHGPEVLFAERTGIYQYNEKTDKFEKSQILDPYFPADEAPFHRTATDPSGNIWISYDSFNYILWKQDDGTYIKDEHSLAQLGELFINHFEFLSNGDTVLLTASHMFHVRESLLNRDRPAPSQPILSAATNLNGSKTFFSNLGLAKESPTFDFGADSRNLVFEFSNPNSSSLKRPSFSFLLEGFSSEWSKWNVSNTFSFPNLSPGDYQLRVKTRLAGSTEESEITVPFSIEPKFTETPLAYLLYLLIAGSVINFGYKHFTKRLKDRNAKLETMVADRTKTIENKNTELERNALELTQALEELRSAQDMIMTTSRKAGMAEVATNVLHNVGNVLNSINVGVLSLSERLEQERVTKLSRVSDLINDNEDRLSDFLTQDPKGKAIPAYLTQLSNVLLDDFSHYQVEVDCIQENIEHIKKIIATQQTHAKTVEVLQTVNLPELIESAVELIMGDLEQSIYEISTDFEAGLEIVSDKHSILQMVTNFIKNAKESIQEKGTPLGLISIAAKTADDPGFVRIQISDNGVGISKENQRKIFTHGFTTKKDGHGFGMHSCANAAKVLGGGLQIESEGLGKGASVILSLPKSPKHKKGRTITSDPKNTKLSAAIR